MRVKRGVPARAKHKKILKAAKGMQHSRTRSFRLAKQGVIRALQYAYRDRENGLTYGQLISGLKKANVELDRKILSELAVNEPAAFTAVVKTVK